MSKSALYIRVVVVVSLWLLFFLMNLVDEVDSAKAALYALTAGVALVVAVLSLPGEAGDRRNLLAWSDYSPSIVAALASIYAGYWWLRDATGMVWSPAHLMLIPVALIAIGSIAAIALEYRAAKALLAKIERGNG